MRNEANAGSCEGKFRHNKFSCAVFFQFLYFVDFDALKKSWKTCYCCSESIINNILWIKRKKWGKSIFNFQSIAEKIFVLFTLSSVNIRKFQIFLIARRSAQYVWRLGTTLLACFYTAQIARPISTTKFLWHSHPIDIIAFLSSTRHSRCNFSRIIEISIR